MRKIKKAIIFLSSILLTFSITGCSISEYQKSIYKDDSKIASQADSYSFRNRVGSTSSGKSSVKFGTFYGMDTLWTIEATKETSISLDIDVRVDSGDFKVVLINPDNRVIVIAEGQKSGTQELKLQMGKSRIKIVGSNAKGEAKLSIKDNNNIKIKQG